VDLLVVYTPAARDGAGGSEAIQSQIQAAVLEANLVLQNSRAHARLRLVHATKVDYVESQSVSNDLARLRNPSDGFLDEVPALRNQCAADLVCLVTETGNDWWYYGLQGPSAANAFSVIRRRYLTGGYYLPVALSFNFGCQLERPYADSVGHSRTLTATLSPAVGGRFIPRSRLSLDSACHSSRIRRFSGKARRRGCGGPAVSG